MVVDSSGREVAADDRSSSTVVSFSLSSTRTAATAAVLDVDSSAGECREGGHGHGREQPLLGVK